MQARSTHCLLWAKSGDREGKKQNRRNIFYREACSEDKFSSAAFTTDRIEQVEDVVGAGTEESGGACLPSVSCAVRATTTSDMQTEAQRQLVLFHFTLSS